MIDLDKIILVSAVVLETAKSIKKIIEDTASEEVQENGESQSSVEQ